MSYRVSILRSVEAQLASWNLPDHLLIEIYLRLRDDLSQNPAERLRRVRAPFDGLEYRFTITDRSNRVCDYVPFFHAVYGQDEESLVIINAGYVRSEVE